MLIYDFTPTNNSTGNNHWLFCFQAATAHPIGRGGAMFSACPFACVRNRAVAFPDRFAVDFWFTIMTERIIYPEKTSSKCH